MIQKAKVLTLIVFGLLFINLSAQEGDFKNDPNAKLPDEDRKFRFGLQFSPNISWLKANTAGYESNGTKVGFSYGLSFEYFMSKNYLFSTGLKILNAGGDVKYNDAIGIYPAVQNKSYKMKYVEIPLLLKLRTNEIGYLTYFGQFGFNTGINFSSKANTKLISSEIPAGYVSTTPGTSSGGVDEDTYYDADTKFFNLSLVIGAGVEYNISGNTSLMLGITYNNGFVNQLSSKVVQYDSSGYPVYDSTGNLQYSEKDASANLNYFALNIGIYF
jgi:hypothetical protein